MIKADYHIHTCYSTDAPTESTLESMFQSAIHCGLNEIAITDHLDFREDGGLWTPMIDYTEYGKAIQQMNEKYSGSIRAVMGIEMGLAPHVTGIFSELAEKHPFEFIIGSSHAINKIDMYVFKDEAFSGRSKDQAYELYYSEMLQLIEDCPYISVYGHLDFIIRYAPYENKGPIYNEYKTFIDQVLKKLVENGKGIELNTSGFNYGLNQPHPSMDIVKAYKKFGGEILTIGSDAHKAEKIAAHYARAEDFLHEAGFSAYTIFRDRKPIWVDL